MKDIKVDITVAGGEMLNIVKLDELIGEVNSSDTMVSDNIIYTNGEYRGTWNVELIDCDGCSNVVSILASKIEVIKLGDLDSSSIMVDDAIIDFNKSGFIIGKVEIEE